MACRSERHSQWIVLHTARGSHRGVWGEAWANQLDKDPTTCHGSQLYIVSELLSGCVASSLDLKYRGRNKHVLSFLMYVIVFKYKFTPRIKADLSSTHPPCPSRVKFRSPQNSLATFSWLKSMGTGEKEGNLCPHTAPSVLETPQSYIFDIKLL